MENLMNEQMKLDRAMDLHRKGREATIVADIIDEMLDKVRNRKSDIIGILANKGTRKQLIQVAMDEIYSAADDNITVPNLRHDKRSNQCARIYIGTHWVGVNQQKFQDFVRKACIKMGFDEMFADDASFQEALLYQLLHKLSGEQSYCHIEGMLQINMLNGTLEIDYEGKATLREHRREDNFLWVLPYCYDPNATCSRWHLFLDEVLPDRESQLALREYMAYCLDKGLRLETILILLGLGMNGKSVILIVMAALLGSSNVSYASLDAIANDPEARAQLAGMLLNIAHEINPKKAIDTNMLKQLISGDTVMVRRLWIGTEPMSAYARLMASCNELPKPENTYAWARRMRIIPFNVTIPKEKANPNLPKELCEELPGILNWVLEVLPALHQHQEFSPCKACDDALYQYLRSSDSALLFISDNCEQSEQPTTGQALYEAYCTFCMENDFKRVGKNTFYKRLDSMSLRVAVNTNIPAFKLKLKY